MGTFIMFALFLFALYRSLLESESHKYVPTWDSVVSLNNSSVIPYVPSIIQRTTALTIACLPFKIVVSEKILFEVIVILRLL